MTPRDRQLTDGWVRMLDVDLELAQRMLRLPPGQRPVPPCAVAAVMAQEWDGSWSTVLPAIAAPEPGAPLVAVRPVVRKGAYARRAAAT